MAGKPLAVRLNVRNARTAAGLKEAIASAPGFFISSNGTPDCDILIAEIEDAGDDMFLQIERIRAQGQVQEIFITSLRKDPEILLRALKAGVREFFPQPLNKAEVVAALEKLKANATAAAGEARQKNGTVISVIGSRGGVGATTAAVNLAVFLQVSAPGKTVALMDMNPLGAAHLFLDIRAEFSWTAALQDIERMDSTYLFNVLSRHRSGIHVLPAPVKPAGHEAASPEALEKLVGLMRAAFDIIVMDNSKVMDHLTIRLLALSNTILVVSELNILSLVNARKLLDAFDGLGISYGKDIKIAMNRYEKRSMVSPAEAERTLARKIDCLIPNDYETTMAALNAGKTLLEHAAKSAVGEQYRLLSGLLLNKAAAPKEQSALSNLMSNFKSLAQQFQKRVPDPRS